MPGLLLGTLFEAGEIPDLGVFTLPATANGANSAALTRSSELLYCCATCLMSVPFGMDVAYSLKQLCMSSPCA